MVLLISKEVRGPTAADHRPPVGEVCRTTMRQPKERPIPEDPVPEIPIPEVPIPEDPVPKVPILEVPILEVLILEVPILEVPILKVPIPEVPRRRGQPSFSCEALCSKAGSFL